MKIMWIGGNHPRHLYYINKIQKNFKISGAIIEIRENMIPQPSNNIMEVDRQNFILHFKNRDEAEKRYFGRQELPICPILEVTENDLNSDRSANFLNEIKPNIVLLFGCGIIKNPLYSALPKHTINLHLGLSPRYRGSATLFWPFYFMEPGYAGSTFHYIISEPDAGDIVHQVVPLLSPNDKIHDVACKTVIASSENAVKLLKIFKKKGKWKTHRQRSTGKNFLCSDFRPEHLRVIYNRFNNDIVKHYLDGKLNSKKPRLFRQF